MSEDLKEELNQLMRRYEPDLNPVITHNTYIMIKTSKALWDTIDELKKSVDKSTDINRSLQRTIIYLTLILVVVGILEFIGLFK